MSGVWCVGSGQRANLNAGAGGDGGHHIFLCLQRSAGVGVGVPLRDIGVFFPRYCFASYQASFSVLSRVVHVGIFSVSVGLVVCVISE